MVDPTGLNEQLKNSRKKPPRMYGKSFGAGLLGGIIGGLVFLAIKGFAHLDFFPIFILAGIGVMAMYLYFVDHTERSNRQLPFLFLAGAASTVITLFLYHVIVFLMLNVDITFGNLFDAYFQSTSNSFFGAYEPLVYHFVAFFFTAIGIGLAWLYVAISVPKWEKKHGKDASNSIRRRKR